MEFLATTLRVGHSVRKHALGLQFLICEISNLNEIHHGDDINEQM